MTNWLIIWATYFLSCVGVWALFDVTGGGSFALIVVPPCLASFIHGKRAGLVVTGALVPAIFVINFLTGNDNIVNSIAAALPTVFILGGASYGIGWLQELRRKLTEEIRLRERAQAEVLHSSTMASLGEMAGGVAHEINNPLQIISGYAHRVERAAEEVEDTKVRDTLMKASDGLKNKVKAINEITNSLERYANGDHLSSQQWVSLHEIVMDTLALCQGRFTKTGVELRLVVEENVEVYAAPLPISQVLFALLSNALEAVQDSKDPWVEVRTSGGTVEVLDSGEGIPHSIRHRVTDPFFSTKDVGDGKGLGLSLSNRLLLAHESRVLIGDGSPSKVYFILPQFREITTRAAS